MRCVRYGVIALLLVVVVAAASNAVAGTNPGENFWETVAKWNQVNKDMSDRIRKETEDLKPAEGAALAIKTENDTWNQFVRSIEKGPGQDPVRRSCWHALLILRIQHASLGFKVEELEREMRQVWREDYKPDKFTDYSVLYTRYASEGKVKESARLAEECYKEYSWTWNAADWLQMTIYCLYQVPDLKDRMTSYIDEYSNKYMKQMGSWSTIIQHLAYLEKYSRWDQSAAIAEKCLAAYKDCDWEPGFLRYAVIVHIAQLKSAQKPAAAAPAPGAAAPKPAGTVPVPDPSAARPGAAGKQKDTDIEALIVKEAQRCMEQYPHEPEASAAAYAFMTWAQEKGKDNPELEKTASAMVVKYLTAYKETPYWSSLWQLGQKYVKEEQAEWKALTNAAAEHTAKEKSRKEALDLLIKASQADLNKYSLALRDFVAANPETPEARTAAVAMVDSVKGSNWPPVLEQAVPELAKTLHISFPVSIAFRSEQLASLGSAKVLDASVPIFQDLRKSGRPPPQDEWYAYQNCRRYAVSGEYSLDAFLAYAQKYKGSYRIPDELYYLYQRAAYVGRPDYIVAACGAVTDKLYTTSRIMDQVWIYNISSALKWSVTFAEAMEKDAAAGKGKKPAKGKQAAERESVDQADEQANLLDTVLSKRINLGDLYYATATYWADKIHYKAHGTKTGKQMLNTKEYKDSYYYFYARAYVH